MGKLLHAIQRDFVTSEEITMKLKAVIWRNKRYLKKLKYEEVLFSKVHNIYPFSTSQALAFVAAERRKVGDIQRVIETQIR